MVTGSIIIIFTHNSTFRVIINNINGYVKGSNCFSCRELGNQKVTHQVLVLLVTQGHEIKVPKSMSFQCDSLKLLYHHKDALNTFFLFF